MQLGVLIAFVLGVVVGASSVFLWYYHEYISILDTIKKYRAEIDKINQKVEAYLNDY